MASLAEIVGSSKEKMGLSAGEAATLVAKLATNPEVSKLVMGLGNNASGAPDPKFDALMKEMGARFKADTGSPFRDGFVDKLNADLEANPALAQKMTAAIKSNPAQATLAVRNYQPGKLNEAVKAMEARPAPAAGPVQAPAPVTPAPAANPSATRPAPATPTVARPAPPPVAAPAAPPPVVAPAAIPSPTPSTTADTGAAAIRAGRDQMISALATGSDADIKAFMQKPANVKLLMESAANYGENQPELKDKARGFMDRVNANPNVIKQIGENLGNNPELVRKMAKALDEQKGPINSRAMNTQVNQVLGEIYEKPDKTLGSKQWTDGLQSKMMMGGAMDWVKTNLGIDLKNMLGGLGNMLQGMFAKIGDFFKQFSTGNFMQIGNMNPKAGFFDKLGRSMDQAAAFREREPMLREQADLIVKPGAKGPINDGAHGPDGKPRMKDETVTGPDGKPTTVKVADYRAGDDHRVSVTAIGNNNNKVYLTDNIQPTREPNGNYRWTVAESIDPNTGRAGQLRQLVVSPEESQRLFKIMEQSAAQTGKPLNIQNPNVDQPTAEVQGQRTVMAYNQGTRQLDQVQQGPAANQPGSPSALNTAAPPKPGDPEFRPGMPAGGAVA
jgi:hypothetical protein